MPENPDHVEYDDSLSITWIEDLYWADRPGFHFVAAARFKVQRVMSGNRVTVIDAFLEADGRVELWEDDDFPGVDFGGGYSGRPHPDWRDALIPILRAALKANPRQRQEQRRRAEAQRKQPAQRGWLN